MQALRDPEKLEIEILEFFNSIRVLDYLYFGGGTMLRLCHNLNRYSTDLDFWLDAKSDSKKIYSKCKSSLSANYQLANFANKKNTLLFELKAPAVTRSLKIEIRKGQFNFSLERKIAFSRFTNKQVMVKGLTLQQMMNNKIEVLISRELIRDAFDIEFFLMRGVDLPADKEKLEKALMIINNFKEQEFKVTLGSVLEEKDRKFYLENRFKFLKEELTRNIILLR
ncbi:hypothetical protein BMS3Abin03_03164 [bacterium BMS3Abin03]|nr:hypothetical protein BMS3Abin03_03164 [bacterium BMS3Abin03]